MSSSEIAKLETRWQENPQGLTFAPLAEAYRKLREPQRALEVLAAGLARHPDYIPASIVLGRCHLDLGEALPAETAFRRVLELDDENVIALKALADIAERDGRFDEAEARLRDLLAVDRSNEEARAQLARVEAAAAAGPVAREDAPEAPDTALPPVGFDWEPEEPRIETAAEYEYGGAGAEVEPLPDLVVDDVPDISSESPEVTPLGGLVGEDFPEYSAAVTPLSDLAPGSASIDDDVLRDEDDEFIPGIEPDDEIELSPSGSGGFQIESATEEWVVEDDELPAEEPEPPLEPDLVVTESMAEVYMDQGHHSEALRVYRELYERNRDDLRLREKVDALETALAVEESEPGTSAPPAPRERSLSVAAFLTGILSSRPGGAPAWTPASGATQALSAEEPETDSPDAAPTRPASDRLSLSAVFGDAGSPVPPAVPGAAPDADDQGISFDAFFGGDSSAAPSRARGATRDDDDLEQFHAWLQNLKR